MDEHIAQVLLDDQRPEYLGGQFVSTVVSSLDHEALVEFARSGRPMEIRPPRYHRAIEALTAQDIAVFFQEGLSALPDLAAALAGGGRVLDVHCGGGKWLIAVATQFPETTLVGRGAGAGFAGAGGASRPGVRAVRPDHDRGPRRRGPALAGPVRPGLLPGRDPRRPADPVASLRAAWACVRPGGRLVVLDWCLPETARGVTLGPRRDDVGDPARPALPGHPPVGSRRLREPVRRGRDRRPRHRRPALGRHDLHRPAQLAAGRRRGPTGPDEPVRRAVEAGRLAAWNAHPASAGRLSDAPYPSRAHGARSESASTGRIPALPSAPGSRSGSRSTAARSAVPFDLALSDSTAQGPTSPRSAGRPSSSIEPRWNSARSSARRSNPRSRDALLGATVRRSTSDGPRDPPPRAGHRGPPVRRAREARRGPDRALPARPDPGAAPSTALDPRRQRPARSGSPRPRRPALGAVPDPGRAAGTAATGHRPGTIGAMIETDIALRPATTGRRPADRGAVHRRGLSGRRDRGRGPPRPLQHRRLDGHRGRPRRRDPGLHRPPCRGPLRARRLLRPDRRPRRRLDRPRPGDRPGPDGRGRADRQGALGRVRRDHRRPPPARRPATCTTRWATTRT